MTVNELYSPYNEYWIRNHVVHILFLIICHAFLPPWRRGSHVKSDFTTYTRTTFSPWPIATVPVPTFYSLPQPHHNIAPSARTTANWYSTRNRRGRTVKLNTGASKHCGANIQAIAYALKLSNPSCLSHTVAQPQFIQTNLGHSAPAVHLLRHQHISSRKLLIRSHDVSKPSHQSRHSDQLHSLTLILFHLFQAS